MNVINKIDEEIDKKMSEINEKIVNIKMKIDKETHASNKKMNEKLDKINMKIDMINKIDGKMDGMIEGVKKKIYMIYGEVYVLGEINEDEVCKRMSVLNKIEDKIDEIANLIKMEMGGINEEMDRELDEKMDEETMYMKKLIE